MNLKYFLGCKSLSPNLARCRFSIFLLFFILMPHWFKTQGKAQETLQTPIHFQSEQLRYQEKDLVILASGNVTVIQSSYTFHSDQARIDIPNKKMEAWGHVRFKDLQKNEIRSQSLKYDSGDGSAQLLEAEGAFGPWLFSTKKISRDSFGNLVLERARLSTCETDLSKYHLYGYRIKVMPKKRLTVQHALFRVGPIPVLYLPYYYYSLGERHLSFQIFPGQNNSEGAFVRTIWGYPPTDEIYLKLYLELLSKRGFGTGGEINYYSDDIKGSIYGFRIRDKLNERERWNARIFHRQEFLNHWLLQINGNQMSDDSFSNDFFREDFDRVVKELNSSVSLTYQKKTNIFRIVSQREDAFDSKTNEFFANEILTPKIEFQKTQSKLGLFSLEKIYSLSFTNRFAGQSPLGGTLTRSYRKEFNAQFSLIDHFRLLSNTNLTPKITIQNDWIDRPQGNELNEKSVQRVTGETTLRQGLSSLDIDLTHKIVQRLQNNLGADQGREEHLLSFLSWFRPKETLSIRLETAFELPRQKGESLSFLNKSKVRPIKGEISIFPKENLEIFFREEYTLSDPITGSKHPLSSMSEISWGQRALGGDYFSLGTNYLSSRDHSFELKSSARISPNKKWQIEGSLRNLFQYRNQNMFYIQKGEFLEKEAMVKTEWRCWNFSFIFRERKGVYEFLFNLELQLERSQRDKIPVNQNGGEWYPWRSLQ